MKRINKNVLNIVIFLIIAFLVIFLNELCHSYSHKVTDLRENLEERELSPKGTNGIIAAKFSLEKGDYNIDVTDFSAKENMDYRIVDLNRNDGYNRSGLVLAEGSIAEGAESLHTHLTVDNSSTNIGVIFVTDDDKIEFSDKAAAKVSLVDDDFTDWIFIYITVVAIGLFIYWCILKGRKDYLLLTAIVVVMTVPFYYEKLLGISGQDWTYHINRIIGIRDNLRAGNIPPRLNYYFFYGTGDGSSTYYPELFLYLPAILGVLGVSPMIFYKLFILFINFMTAFIGYYSFTGLLKSKKKGLLCAVLYIVQPYRLADLYQRQALGEALALVFLPLLFYGVYEIIYGDERKWLISVLGATGVLQSHILTTEMAAMFVAVFVLVSLKNLIGRESVGRWISIGKALVVTLALNLWFLVPFVIEMLSGRDIYIATSSSISGTAIFIWQLFATFIKMHGRTMRNIMSADERPYSIGIILLICALIYIYYRFISKKKFRPEIERLADLFLIFGIFSCYMATTLFPWELIDKSRLLSKVFNVMQFASRMNSFSGFFLTVVSAVVLFKLYEEKRKIILCLLTGICLVASVNIIDSTVLDMSEVQESRNEAFENVTIGFYYDKAFNTSTFKQNRDLVTTEGGELDISNYSRWLSDLDFSFKKGHEDLKVMLPYYNYRGYRVYVNDKEVDIDKDAYQLEFELPGNITEGFVRVEYSEGILYRMCEVVSVLTIILFIVMSLKKSGKLCLHKGR